MDEMTTETLNAFEEPNYMPKHSAEITELAAAFVAFQADVTNPANTARNPHFNSKYAPLSEILNTVRGPLGKHGLAVYQNTISHNGKTGIVTLLLHKSGQWIESSPLWMTPERPSAQGQGSCITYARRYSLSAALGISSEDDDDANEASLPAVKMPQKAVELAKPAPKPNGKPKLMTEQEAKGALDFALRAGWTEKELLESVKKEFGVKAITEIPYTDKARLATLIQGGLQVDADA